MNLDLACKHVIRSWITGINMQLIASKEKEHSK